MQQNNNKVCDSTQYLLKLNDSTYKKIDALKVYQTNSTSTEHAVNSTNKDIVCISIGVSLFVAIAISLIFILKSYFSYRTKVKIKTIELEKVLIQEGFKLDAEKLKFLNAQNSSAINQLNLSMTNQYSYIKRRKV